ncbi:hypothetical protein Glove_94g27 [Diversispora epigaea]|nr:hypothetical protein Glove_94g27 [Diversispora epigaea]
MDFVNVDQIIQVHDYNTVSMTSYDATAKAASKSITQILQDNYPEFLAVKLFINIPWWGDYVFKFISIFLSEQTKKKFIVTSSSGVKDQLTNFIDENNLPNFYGGYSKVPEIED